MVGKQTNGGTKAKTESTSTILVLEWSGHGGVMCTGVDPQLLKYMNRKYGSNVIPNGAWQAEAEHFKTLPKKQTEAQLRIEKGHIVRYPDGSLGLPPPKNPIQMGEVPSMEK